MKKWFQHRCFPAVLEALELLTACLASLASSEQLDDGLVAEKLSYNLRNLLLESLLEILHTLENCLESS